MFRFCGHGEGHLAGCIGGELEDLRGRQYVSDLIGGGGHMNLHSGGSHSSDYIGDGHIDRWRSAEAGAYQSPGNADSTCGSLWSWTFGHATAYRDGGQFDMRIFKVFLITLVVAER